MKYLSKLWNTWVFQLCSFQRLLLIPFEEKRYFFTCNFKDTIYFWDPKINILFLTEEIILSWSSHMFLFYNLPIYFLFYFMFLIIAWGLIQFLTVIFCYPSCATIPWVAQVRAANKCPIKMLHFYHVAIPLFYHVTHYSYKKFHWAVQALLMLLSSL